ncbi:MAG: outer membrane beta-barrel protein [Bacteroidota bacterium]|nr:outer membrane beta-barrel protein [Bacteroidota bacterium]
MKQIFLLLVASVMMLSLTAQQVDTIPEVTEAPEISEVPEVPDVPEDPVVEEVIIVEDESGVEEVIIVEEGSEVTWKGDTVSVIRKVEVIETPESTRVTLGENQVFIVEENGDTVKIVLGARGISIVEGDEGTVVKIMEMEDFPKKSKKHKKRFRAHFAGLEVGLNNYVTPDFSMTLPQDERYMDLNTGKSWNWNINIIDYGFGLGTDKVGIVSGLGFEFINYNFDGQNSIRKDPDTGVIIEYVPDYAGNITKSKMNMTYLTAPLLLEFQIPAPRSRIYISGGVIGGLKLWSNTKMKYTVSGEKSKEKAKGDYNLSPLRWGFTARVGYRALGFYANYYMTSLFKTDMGPELYPFAVGFAFTF